jgi:hypothetical protein
MEHTEREEKIPFLKPKEPKGAGRYFTTYRQCWPLNGGLVH